MRTPKTIAHREGIRANTGVYARSDSALRIRAERVRRIVAAMRKAMPWLTPADVPAMRGWAELEVLSATVFAWLLKLNVLNSEGEPRRLLSEHRQMKLAQLSYESALGMTPLARATLKLNTTRAAFDLPAEMVASVNEVGESRRREREAKERKNDDNVDTGGNAEDVLLSPLSSYRY